MVAPSDPKPSKKRRREGTVVATAAAAAADEEDKVFFEVVADVRFQLSPLDMDSSKFNPVLAAEKALAPFLMRYKAALGGVLVAHRGVAFPDAHGASQTPPPFRITQLPEAMLDPTTGPSILAPLDPTSPYAYVWARANCLVFAPAKGSVLVGSVRVVAKDYVSLRVWKVFHAVITLKDAPSSYNFKPSSGALQQADVASWKSVDEDEETIAVGSLLRFSVKAFRHSESGLVTLKGSLMTATGCGVVGRDEDDAEGGASSPPPAAAPATGHRKRRRTVLRPGSFIVD